MSELNRRKLLAVLSAGMATATVPMAAFASHRRDNPLSMIPNSIFDPRHFGAKGDGKALDSSAINAAIDACALAGGGIVYLSPGIYRSGTVTLKSNVTLYIEAGATLLGSTDINDYALQPGPPLMADADQQHLIFARDAENVTLCGPGRIDGQGSSYWKKRTGRSPLPPEDAWKDVIAGGWMKNGRRPSPMLEFVNCRWLRVEDIRIEGAAGWTMHPANCSRFSSAASRSRIPTMAPTRTASISTDAATYLFPTAPSTPAMMPSA